MPASPTKPLIAGRSPVDYSTTPGRAAKPSAPTVQAGALPRHGPASAAPATAQSAVLDASVHVQRPPTAPPSSVRPRWSSRTSPVTQTASIHETWKVHQRKSHELLGRTQGR